MRIKEIAIFGFADAKENSQVYKEAFETAKLLAENGFVIINGGGPGVMKATTLGAKAAGGKTIGVTFYPKETTNFEGRDPTNPIDQEIKTANYVERTLKLLEMADCYIVFNGGTGTISEFAMAWGLAHLYFGHHKPLVLVGKFWQDIISVFTKHMFLSPQELRVFRIVAKPEEVLKTVSYFEQSFGRRKHRHKDNFEEAFQI
ncbi:hypothetical protein A2Z23_01400 [Candidatus Curtissbacteria bacterium RBG_16_39_7]|uniref:LOG family protein n=1 Tax=Candidatus Curtissbacteria bacterium RBG_16_39_7 TaxID=1797707 RepID=A0A1F5G4V5_9BACT|nr:MAG: hypothetical protein A2Z23_01400 [Candidatus Curtissbacteria bacterium RBG_16_39_7]